MDVFLTNDAKLYAAQLYANYLQRLNSGESKTSAKNFGFDIAAQLLPKMHPDDAREVQSDFLSAFPADRQYVHNFIISSTFIACMEGKFARNLNTVLDYIAKVKAIVWPV